MAFDAALGGDIGTMIRLSTFTPRMWLILAHDLLATAAAVIASFFIRFEEAGLAPPRLDLQSRPIGFYFDGDKMIEIVNAHRTATSYRTAFSCFLSASAEAK